MIHESYYWKNELYNSFLTIARFRHSKQITEELRVETEKALMIGAYIIRKLDEARKIPPKLLSNQEKLDWFKSKGTSVDYMNWHNIDKHYNLEKESKIKRNWRFIVNQIIHSFSLFFSFDGSDKLDGFFVNSDKTKEDGLFFLPIKTLLTIFLSISEGDLTMTHSQRQIVGKEINGEPKFGEMILTDATYSYLDDFNISSAITNSLKGDIYQRK